CHVGGKGQKEFLSETAVEVFHFLHGGDSRSEPGARGHNHGAVFGFLVFLIRGDGRDDFASIVSVDVLLLAGFFDRNVDLILRWFFSVLLAAIGSSTSRLRLSLG